MKFLALFDNSIDIDEYSNYIHEELKDKVMMDIGQMWMNHHDNAPNKNGKHVHGRSIIKYTHHINNLSQRRLKPFDKKIQHLEGLKKAAEKDLVFDRSARISGIKRKLDELDKKGINLKRRHKMKVLLHSDKLSDELHSKLVSKHKKDFDIYDRLHKQLDIEQALSHPRTDSEHRLYKVGSFITPKTLKTATPESSKNYNEINKKIEGTKLRRQAISDRLARRYGIEHNVGRAGSTSIGDPTSYDDVINTLHQRRHEVTSGAASILSSHLNSRPGNWHKPGTGLVPNQENRAAFRNQHRATLRWMRGNYNPFFKKKK